MTAAASIKVCPSCHGTFADSQSHCPHDGVALVAQVDTGIGPGRVVAGKYRILERLGEGAMGAVLLAEQDSIGRKVAVKVLKRHLSSDPNMIRRFRREAKAASRIDDPRTVAVLDFGEDDGELFLVMELIEGETLSQRLEGRTLPLSEALDIAIDICGALDSAHTAGVVHRDLKPDNIMLTRRGIKVLDFGIARVESSPTEVAESHLTTVGALLGTPLYMSPEAAGRRKVEGPADLYALGVILFEMLIGRPVFEDEEMVILLGMHLKMKPETLEQASGGSPFPPALETLLHALLAKMPSQRPTARAALAQMVEIRSALAAVSNEGTYVSQSAASERFRRDSDPQHAPARALLESLDWSADEDALTGVMARHRPAAAEDPRHARSFPVPAPFIALGIGLALVGLLLVGGLVLALRESNEPAGSPVPPLVSSPQSFGPAVRPGSPAERPEPPPQHGGPPPQAVEVREEAIPTQSGILALSASGPCTLIVDDEPVGHAPRELELPLGGHMVRCQEDRSTAREIEVTPGRREHQLAPAPRPARSAASQNATLPTRVPDPRPTLSTERPGPQPATVW